MAPYLEKLDLLLHLLGLQELDTERQREDRDSATPRVDAYETCMIAYLEELDLLLHPPRCLRPLELELPPPVLHVQQLRGLGTPALAGSGQDPLARGRDGPALLVRGRVGEGNDAVDGHPELDGKVRAHHHVVARAWFWF